ncbi:hypothetical protein PAXRUDRAFT_13930 [Paxillus rubicundulus Ve08.2h10]|uniref:Uncharacterized protein n=1 Tax=Paxillus rubicundulus Ve08.2h10 TaxID=930991 RepID=A0A0D0DXM2_9AGAM|nr:hypothetical protein PAXRUDRAFT_18932 [Paxillus rubicundulus Ve08.2h10]KIK77130.1 hypothetical protein PAXRUDRAFT_17699 [Paxillus rubicundulus Ve08.2h10]KIK91159.1 hypothetical protein PAXRUDRAFT_13930 [Paxillus rubicundulus Ve08.2h10]
MRAQAAARASSTASGSKSSADSERRERSPTVITPPRSSPLLQREVSPPASFLPQQRESSPPALSPPPPSPTPLSPVRHREVSPGPSCLKSSGLVPSGSELSDLDEDRETVTLKGKRRVQKGKKVSSDSDDNETNTAKDSGARKPQKQKRPIVATGFVPVSSISASHQIVVTRLSSIITSRITLSRSSQFRPMVSLTSICIVKSSTIDSFSHCSVSDRPPIGLAPSIRTVTFPAINFSSHYSVQTAQYRPSIGLAPSITSACRQPSISPCMALVSVGSFSAP